MTTIIETTSIITAAATDDIEHGTTNVTSEQREECQLHSSTCFNKTIRTGKALVWKDISMELKSKDGSVVEKAILTNVWGSAKPGETTAIMGASGAGKTSLFLILAGRTKSHGRMVISDASSISLGDSAITPSTVRSSFAFCSQDDSLHAPSTPRQSLYFSAKLRLPKTTTEIELNELVDDFITQLGLTLCADTMIGGPLQKGISGGEKRRVSIGVELVANPSIIFCDEPTSGLDSFAAKQVMGLLKTVALAGNTVLFTIHQPSSNLFSSFDRLLLLHQGKVMYTGRTMDVPADFARLGYPCPTTYNPADWVVDVAQLGTMDELESHGFFPKKQNDMSVAVVMDEPKSIKEGTRSVDPSNENNHVSTWTELVLLVKREYTSVTKSPMPMIINVSLTGFLAVVFGVIFFGIGKEDRSNALVVQGVLGALVNIMISTMMGQSQTALTMFSSERPLFLREYSTNHYSILPYFLSHLATEALNCLVAIMIQSIIVYYMIGFQMTFFQFFTITFTLAMTSTAVSVWLGAIFSNPKSAQALFTLVVVPQFYFSGVFVSTNLIPVWVRWAQYLCSLKYAAGLGYIYEFTNCAPGQASINCSNVLAQNNVNESDVWWYWLALLVLLFMFRFAALIVLRRKGRDFD